jgi:heat shock protein HslJ
LKLGDEGFAGAFTLTFGDGQIHGRAAPNTYRAPYEQGADQALSIGNAAATLMAPLREPTDLKENEYFTLLGNVYRWDLVRGRLELYTKTGDGEEAVLVF